MTLQKAIEQGTLFKNGYKSRTDPDLLDAVKLLIEAGKLIKTDRELHLYPAWKLLPGETED
ncbi:unnamed protein product [marine sediment metagenome]|uniref:Lipoxygenase domain-containing protein n=1 Tax=marine sediment metagenome TaxID=412755 RepID=X1SKE7_9ZZZZ